RGFSASKASVLSSLVLLSGAAASLVGGWWTDRWANKYGLKIGRCGVTASALVSSGAILATAAFVGNPIAAALLIAVAAGVADLSISSAWALCHDIGGNAAGTVTGCMNTFANIGGTIAPVAMGYAVQWWGSWSTPLLITAVIYVLGGLIALLIDPTVPLAAEPVHESRKERDLVE